MKVEKLTLRNFRNIEDCTLRAGPAAEFPVGANGQGKTSFLEALAFLATLRSFRGAKNDGSDPLGRGTARGHLHACSRIDDPESSHRDWKTDLQAVSFSLTDPVRRKATKVAFINGKPFKARPNI